MFPFLDDPVSISIGYVSTDLMLAGGVILLLLQLRTTQTMAVARRIHTG